VPCVLDASAILAWLQREPGTEIVDPLLPESVVSAVNWSEVLQKSRRKGRDADETVDLLKALGLEVHSLRERDAVTAAAFWFQNSALSLADRCCLALAHRLEFPAVTADRNWQRVPLSVKVIVIR
jgi:PIN domain nuclease of toxin-antitoxin system